VTEAKIRCRAYRFRSQGGNSFPHGKAIGPITAAAIVAKVVSIDRFATPSQLGSYFGVFTSRQTS
jgi:hypothetical protein